MYIEDIKLMTDTLIYNNGIVVGKGIICSKDLNGIKYENEFDFQYEEIDGLLTTDIDENMFSENLEEIDCILTKKLKDK